MRLPRNGVFWSGAVASLSAAMSPDSDMRRLRGRTAASKIALMAWNVQLLGRVAARLLPAERMTGLGTVAAGRCHYWKRLVPPGPVVGMSLVVGAGAP